jgi:hypothetical protein
MRSKLTLSMSPCLLASHLHWLVQLSIGEHVRHIEPSAGSTVLGHASRTYSFR